MEAFRQFLKGWFGKLLLFIFLAPLAFLGIDSYFSGRANSDALVTVEGEDITQQAFNNRYIAVKQQQLQSLNGDISLLDEPKLKAEVLESMIDKAVLQAKAKEYKLYPSDEQIKALLFKDPAFQENGKFSQEKFATVLKRNGIDKRYVFADMRKQMALNQMVSLVNGTGFMTQYQKDNILDLQSEQRHVWVRRLSSDVYNSEVNVTDQDVTDYYNKNKDSLKTKRTVDLSYISLDKMKLTADEPAQADIDMAYDAYVQQLNANKDNEQRKVSHILLTGDNAQADAEKVLVDLNSGKDFAELAKIHSQDSDSKDTGGQLEFLSKDNQVQDASFIEAIYQLKDVGDVSELVKSQFGYHVIRLDAIKPQDIPTKEAMLIELTQNVTAQKLDEQYQEIIKKINLAVVDGVALQDIVKDVGVEVLSAKDFQDGPINIAVLQGHSELNHPDVKKQIFDEFNLAEQLPSVGVTVNEIITVWVQSNNFRPVRIKTLDESKQAIKALLLNKQAKEKAKLAAKALSETVNQATDSKYNIADNADFEEIGAINRQNESVSYRELAGAFSMRLPQDTDTDVIISKAVETDSGYTVVAIGTVKDADKVEIPEQFKKQMMTMLEQMSVSESMIEYLEYLKTTVEITKNEKLIDEVINGKIAEK